MRGPARKGMLLENAGFTIQPVSSLAPVLFFH